MVLFAHWKSSFLKQARLAAHASAKLAVLDVFVGLEALLAAEAPVAILSWFIVHLVHVRLRKLEDRIVMLVAEHVSLFISGDFELLNLAHLVSEDVAPLLQALARAVLVLLLNELSESVLEHLEELLFAVDNWLKSFVNFALWACVAHACIKG